VATSKAHHEGKPATLFIMSYQQSEVQSLDISLILILFRQEMVKDRTMKDIGEKDLEMGHGTAKLVEFEGGQQIKQKMWIVATKHHFTAYGILILAPLPLWEKNPNFAQKILTSFRPK
jgi:hypothetical protein